MPRKVEHDAFDNEEMPDSIPRQNQGEISVIVRLVDEEHGSHYRAAEARRWTKTHVMVALLRAAYQDRDKLVWLRAEDVYRILPGDVADRPGTAGI